MSLKNSEILKNSLPVGFAYIILGFTFGALFASKGGSVIEAFIISTFCFAGAAQFVALEFYKDNFSAYALFLTIFILNLRHLIYGFSFLTFQPLKKNPYLFLSLTDENFAMATLYKNRQLTNFDWMKVFGLNHCYWIVGCSLGSLLPLSYLNNLLGADFALIALFVALLTSNLKKNVRQHGTN